MGYLDRSSSPPPPMNGLLSSEEPPPPKSLRSHLRDLFIPDFLSRRKSATTLRPGPTAWLDGLRGCAALCVTFMHMTVYTHDGIETCYGSKFIFNSNYNNSIAALPILRLPFTGGHFAVMLFFVISGYVVPRRLLQLLQDNRRQEFMEEMQSAMVRRPIRLFLPVILSTILIFISWHVLGIESPSMPKQPNIIIEAWRWLLETSAFVYFYKFGWLYSFYNVHTWTIPVELRGSMLVFVFLIIVHTLSTKARIWLTIGMIFHMSCGAAGAWYACFFTGMLLSDLDLMASAGKETNFFWDRWDKSLRANKPLRGLVLHATFIAALYLATQPNSDFSTRVDTLGNCPGWKTLSRMIPPSYWDADSQFRWFWLFWAATLMLYVTREIGWLRRTFESSTAQYLGRHSFALYLVHGPMITTFSNNLFYMTGVKQAYTDEQKAIYGSIENAWHDASWWPFPDGGPYGMEPNFLFCAAISIPTILYVAEIGTRLFDIPSVKASKWVWQKWKTL